jgi:conjugative relaxase-like TrwC/TraI family protein
MLSLANLTSASAASSYYEQDDYYVKDSKESKESSQWFGKGAKSLALEGDVEKEKFTKVLEGNLPNGKILGRKEADGKVHAPGIDLTFSAPKSVSIMAEVYGDERIVEAHQNAVKETLEYIEANFVSTRAMKDGTIHYDKVDNIIAAIFKHDSSRKLDPQLHTHCVLLNVVQRDDGQWRSAFFGEIFNNKMMLGQMYRAELACSLKALGYEIAISHNDCRFELACVPQDMINDFSKRTRDIEAVLGDKEVSAKIKAKLKLTTRDSKKELSRSELESSWQKTAASYELIPATQEKSWFDKLISFIKGEREFGHYLLDANKPGNIAAKATLYGINHCSERSSIWSKEELFKASIGYSTGMIRPKAIFEHIAKLEKDGILLRCYNPSTQKECFATLETLALEKQTIALMRKGRGKEKSVYDNVDAKLADSSLNMGQRAAVDLILTSNDKVIGIQGYAGTGKTFMLATAQKLMNEKEVSIYGLAPSSSAARTLENDTGIKSTTLQKFLAKYDSIIHERATINTKILLRSQLKNSFIVLDESSLASTQQINGLLKLAHDMHFRLVLVGDKKQLGAVEAGVPFNELQKKGMNTAVMGAIIRQKDPSLKSAVFDVINGNIKQALNKIEDNVICLSSMQSKQSLASVAADKWLRLSLAERERTIITSPSNKIRAQINNEIRLGLIEEGLLKAEVFKQNTMVSKDFTQAEKTNPYSYERDDVVYFHKANNHLKIGKGEYLAVESVNQYGVVTILKENSNKVFWQPSKFTNRAHTIDVFVTKELEIRGGETIKFTKSTNEWAINTATAKVLETNNNNITLKLEDGSIKTISKDNQVLKHIDYGYASTVHAAQGKTKDNVIGVIEANHKYLTTANLFYVSLSRARHKATIITDNKEQLAITLSKQSGAEISAVDSRLLHLQQESATKAPINAKEPYRKISTQEIYQTLYDRLPSALPEFGFKQSGDHYISTTEVKIDGSIGKKGKVYVYANNPGLLKDYTRAAVSIWDYVGNRHLNTQSKDKIMAYLVGLTGIGKSVEPHQVKTQEGKEVAVPMRIDQQLLADIERYAKEKLFESATNPVLKYLTQVRGYDLPLIEKMGIGYIDSHKNLKDYLAKLGYAKDGIEDALKTLHFIGKTHKLVIAFEDKEGKVSGFIGRDIYHNENSPFGKYMYSKGLNKSEQLFNLHNVKGIEVWLVEGIFDCLHAKAKGLDNIVALGGTSFNEKSIFVSTKTKPAAKPALKSARLSPSSHRCLQLK